MEQVLPRRYRLQDHRAFPQIYSRGKRRSGSLLGLTYLPRSHGRSRRDKASASRFAVVVSKKVSRKATLRNRVKRRVRSAVYPLLSQIQPGYWIVFSARPSILTSSWEEVRQEVIRLLEKARLIG